MDISGRSRQIEDVSAAREGEKSPPLHLRQGSQEVGKSIHDIGLELLSIKERGGSQDQGDMRESSCSLDEQHSLLGVLHVGRLGPGELSTEELCCQGGVEVSDYDSVSALCNLAAICGGSTT